MQRRRLTQCLIIALMPPAFGVGCFSAMAHYDNSTPEPEDAILAAAADIVTSPAQLLVVSGFLVGAAVEGTVDALSPCEGSSANQPMGAPPTPVPPSVSPNAPRPTPAPYPPRPANAPTPPIQFKEDPDNFWLPDKDAAPAP